MQSALPPNARQMGRADIYDVPEDDSSRMRDSPVNEVSSESSSLLLTYQVYAE
jgi:hypothetical protein